MHKIMPIFTFMGASLLRMDDTYSMQIVRKTVETVVPAVLKVVKLMYMWQTLGAFLGCTVLVLYM